MYELSKYDDLFLNRIDKLKVESLKRKYMKSYNPTYHDEAEKIRLKYGYSGGIDGSRYMPICKCCGQK